MPNILEKHIEQDMRIKLERMGCLFWKWADGPTGVPDRICVYPGGVVFVELKSSSGRLSPRQKYVQKQMRMRGATVMNVHGPMDVEPFLKYVTDGIAAARSVGILEEFDKGAVKPGVVHPKKLPDIRDEPYRLKPKRRTPVRTWFRENSEYSCGDQGAGPGEV